MKRQTKKPANLRDLMKRCKGCRSWFFPSHGNQVWCWTHHAMDIYTKRKLYNDLFRKEESE